MAEVRARTGLELAVLDPLPGGEQEGAHLVIDGDGRRLVLKVQPDRWKAKRLLRAVPVMDHAVTHGWPAAAWLYAGALSDGSAFLLEEYVEGEPITSLDPITLEIIEKANALQSGLAIPEAVDDSHQLEAVAAGDHPWKTLVRDRSAAGTALIRHGDAVIRRLGAVRLPTSDLVHGDYSPSNMVMTAGRTVRFIDCETVARGTRIRDLADLYRGAFVYSDPSAVPLRPLCDRACAIAGPAVFATCVVAVSYNNLAWWAEHRPASAFDRACERIHVLFEDITDH